FKYIKYSTRLGKDATRLDLVEEEIPIATFMQSFRSLISPYIKHSHYSKWQATQFKTNRDTFPIGSILSVVDFAENYSFSHQKEIQTQYYHTDQVTIMVQVFYRHAQLDLDGVESTYVKRMIKKEYHFYISDDKEHDTHFVQHCFGLFFQYLHQRGIQIDHHFVWSDGCASQFKSSRPFFALSRYHRHHKIPHLWSFFESGHGKGEHDGAGACIKRALKKQSFDYEGDRLIDAHTVVEWCKKHFAVQVSTSQASTSHVSTPHRVFWEITGEWKQVPLVVDDTYGSDHDDSFEDVPLISIDYDHISGLVKQGDVFAVIAEEANIEKVEYYLLRCTEERTKLTCEITSEVTTFFTGSVVVQGTYLQQVKALQSGIHFVDYKPDKKVYHYTHHIIATGLQLQQVKTTNSKRKKWRLDVEDHEKLLQVIEQRAEPL
ncbi:hypothetical protein KI387_026096, partial [Taxus chinensis]